MPDLDQRMTLAVILKNFPYAGHVLQRHGLDDLLCWLGTPLQEACRQLKLDPARIVADIKQDGLEPPKPRSTLIVDPGSEKDALAAAQAERDEIEAELTAEEPEEAPAPPLTPEQQLPDVAAMFRARPAAEPATKRAPKPTAAGAPAAKPAPKLDPAAQAKAEAEAKARAEKEAELSASLPDVASMFRARPVAPPPPATPEEQAEPGPQKGLVVPPKDSGSVLSKVMSWDRPD